jgi:hypothetical protein
MRLTWDKVTFQTPEHMLPTPCSVPPAPRVAPATTLALIEKHVQPELATFYPRASKATSNNARVRTMPSASAIYACAVLDRQGLTSSELCKQRQQDAARAKDWARTSTYDPRWIPAILGLGLTISSTHPPETETAAQVEEGVDQVRPLVLLWLCGIGLTLYSSRRHPHLPSKLKTLRSRHKSWFVPYH